MHSNLQGSGPGTLLTGVTCDVTCSEQGYHCMQFVRTETHVTPCHRQTLMPQQICDVFKRRTLHSQPAGKRMPQVVPTKVLNSRFTHRFNKPMPPIFERFACPGRMKHTPSAVAPVKHNPNGSYPKIVQRDGYGFFVLRPRNIQHPAPKVYHVPSQSVLGLPLRTGLRNAVDLHLR